MAVPKLAHADAANPTSTIAIGDWWKYDVQTPIAGLILTGSQTNTIVYQASTDATEWTGQTHGSGTLAGLGTTGTWVEGGTGHLRKSDLADVDSRFTLNITIVGLTTAVVYLSINSVNSPPVTSYQFPLSVGSSWSMNGGTDTITTSHYYSFNNTVVTNVFSNSTNAVYNVLSSPLTTVPAGTFDSYQIRERNPDGTYMDTYYSPETENEVQVLGFAANGTQESSMTLTDWGAWPYKSTVGLTAGGTSYNAVVGTDVSATNIHQDGHSIIFTMTGTDSVTGKASVWIPVQANNTVIKVSVDTNTVSYSASSNQTFYQIIFTFKLSTHTVTVTYSASSFLQQYLIPIIIGLAVLAAVIALSVTLLVRRNRRKPQPGPSWQTPPSTPPTPAEIPPPAPTPANQPP